MIFALFFFIMAALFLGSAILSILLPFLTTALTVVATGLLLWNAVVLVLLLLFRFLWNRAGRLEKAYIHHFTGWKYYVLQGTRLLLTAGILWEILVMVVCVILLLTHPLDNLLPTWAV